MTTRLSSIIRCCSWIVGSALLVAGLVRPVDAQSVEQVEISLLEIPPGDPPPAEGKANTDEVEDMIFQRTNAFRVKHDLKPLERNENLKEAAQYFAQYMARTRRYGHLADGQRPSARASNHDYKYCIIRENIAYAYKSNGYQTKPLAEEFVTGWIESKGHRKNMLSSYVSDMAVAVARSDETGYYLAVQMFGRPESEKISAQFVNRTDETVEYKLFVQEKPDADKTFELPPRLIRSHERCRPTSVRFSFMKEDQRLPIETGATYVVTQSVEGELQVVKEEPEQDKSAAEPGSESGTG